MYSESSDEGSAPRPRQKPGSACEECRRRKLRCNRGQPRCGVCVESGIDCKVNPTRPPRGPKKGHFKALRSRVGWYSQSRDADFSKLIDGWPAILEQLLIEQPDDIAGTGGESLPPLLDNSKEEPMVMESCPPSAEFEPRSQDPFLNTTTWLESCPTVTPRDNITKEIQIEL